MSATIELLESEEETVNPETVAHSEKAEDLFESARRAFFSNSEGEAMPPANQKQSTQVKSYDGPTRAPKK